VLQSRPCRQLLHLSGQRPDPIVRSISLSRQRGDLAVSQHLAQSSASCRIATTEMKVNHLSLASGDPARPLCQSTCQSRKTLLVSRHVSDRSISDFWEEVQNRVHVLQP
jgi:hypothetical protein